MKLSKQFEHGKGDWEKLYTFMDENDFSCADFLACVCANLNSYPNEDKYYKTKLMVGGKIWNIEIEKE